jgi:hypothetical protein
MAFRNPGELLLARVAGGNHAACDSRDNTAVTEPLNELTVYPRYKGPAIVTAVDDREIRGALQRAVELHQQLQSLQHLWI